MQLFDNFCAKFEKTITEKNDSVLRSILVAQGGCQLQLPDVALNQNHEETIMENAFTLWLYKGKFWHVTETFALPAKTKRKRAWELWITDMELENGERVRPF
jgi:hypothetical protein